MKTGFIGCGNMARAMITGALRSGRILPEEITVSAPHARALSDFATPLGIRWTQDNREVAANAELLILAVKPHLYSDVIREISPSLPSSALLIGIAPGVTLRQMERDLGRPAKIIRTMPNTPVTVSEGMTAMCCNSMVSEEEASYVETFLRSFGHVERIREEQIDAIVAVSGSSPAYVFMMIEAMADAAVLKGLSREQSYRLAAQAVLGAAKMVLERGEHPAILKDRVCSPGGTTIEAVRVLEEKGFRSALMEAMAACAEKSAGMGANIRNRGNASSGDPF